MSKERSSQRGPGGFGSPMANVPHQKVKNFKITFKRLIRYLAPYKARLFTVFMAAVLGTVFTIVGPKILGKATTKIFEGVIAKNAGIGGIDFDYLFKILVMLVCLYIISASFTFIQQYLMASVAQSTVYTLRKEAEDKISKLPLKYFDGTSTGEILSRVINDVDNISTTLQQSLTQIITSVFTLIGITVMMLTISPVMTVILLCTLPVSGIITVKIAKRSQKHFGGQQEKLGILSAHVEETYTGHEVVKAFGREPNVSEKFKEINERLYDSAWRAQFISGIIMPLMNFVNNIGYVLICVIGGVMVTQGRINVGDIQAFIQYVRQFSQPISQTANIANIIQSTVASAERVFELLDEEEQVPEAVNPKDIQNPQGNVRFDHVAFGYKENSLLIEDLNVEVKAGQKVAIVGPTGAGKTTFINLLMRFYELNGGTIFIDDVNIADMKRSDLRKMFGMVLQDTWLFNGTIMANIAYGREGASEAQVVEAAKAAHADHFIRTLPEGYQTVLNEEGTNISQGQKQLLTIARAILANPSILILDEATSSVDTRTEIHIQHAMNALMNGRTSFVIAHRLSTIKDADLILVMNKGSVIEQGSHESLLEQGGFYADLYNSQFSGGNLTKDTG